MADFLGGVQPAWCRESKELQELVKKLADTDPEIRRRAAQAVGSFSFPESGFDGEVVEALAEALTNDDREIRVAAARAFSHLSMLPGWPLSRQAVDALVGALEDPEVSVLKNAAHALGHVTDPRVLVPLIVAMRTDDSGVISAASGASRHLLNRGLVTDEAIQALIDSLGYERASRHVISLLAMVRDRVPVGPLITLLAHEPVRVRRGAAAVLAALERPEAAGPLTAALDDEDQEVRRQVTLALGRIPDPDRVRDLAKAAEDREEVVRLAAVAGLQRGGTAALEILLRRLTKDESPKVRREAAIGLRTIGDSRAAAPLLDALKTEENYDTWIEIASGALGHWNDNKEVARAIVQALTKPDPRVRKGAAIALQVDSYKVLLLNTEEAKPLAEVLSDPEVEVRKAAVGALKLLAQERRAPGEAIVPLQAAANDEDLEVRRFAKETLGLLSPPPHRSPESRDPRPKP
ncbi:MAG: HEAT repeat domain-containing protein [candidate division NC10 bacterium]|nr:HEAT repeat domain-containing protein [candidate division NC10 bacterium]